MQVLFLFFSIFLLFYFLKTCQSAKTSRFTGICASITAANIKTHPSNSLPDKTSCNTRKPAITETTDSKLINKDATVGFNPFCAITCNVYPTPQDKTPDVYKRQDQISRIFYDISIIFDAEPLISVSCHDRNTQ